MSDVETPHGPHGFEEAMREAERLLDKGRGQWLPVLTGAIAFGAAVPFGLWPAGIVAGAAGLIVGGIVLATLRKGPWGPKGVIVRACARAGLKREQAVPHLPARLRDAPDIREFLDCPGFKQEMQERSDATQRRVQSALAKPLCIDESAVRNMVSHPKEQLVFGGASDDIETTRIQAVHAVCTVVGAEMNSIISARMKRAGDLMMRQPFGQSGAADVSTVLQAAVSQANAEMTQQWAEFYRLYAILGGSLMKILKEWQPDEAIDTLMGWPGDLHPFPAMSGFLQAFWETHKNGSGVPPRMLAGRTMCWIYCFPDRWETLKRTTEMATVHEAALREGKVVAHALKPQWREFGKEISRHATILAAREEHKSNAEATLENCVKM